MPTYGYRCESCGTEFEVLQRMSDPPQAACPSCSGAGKRLFFPAGILFKGSGFYKTDSRGSETASANGNAPAPAPATAPATAAAPATPTPSPPPSTSKAGAAAPASKPSAPKSD